MFEIDWSAKARRQVAKIADTPMRNEIFDAVGKLTGFPRIEGVKRLTNHKYEYRLRVGRYRVLFDVRSEIRIIEIQEVKKRDDRTY